MDQNTVRNSAGIYLADIDLIGQAQIAALESRLTAAELLRYQRFSRPLRQRQFLVGRHLLRQLLTRALLVSEDRVILTERAGQAPLVHIEGVAVAPYFSLSHTANWVACAMSHSTPVGLDIEWLDANRNLAAISEHTFPAEENAWFKRQLEENRVRAFYQLWSTREARYKLTQSHAYRASDVCYVVPHPALSIVLMTGQALCETPTCETMALHV